MFAAALAKIEAALEALSTLLIALCLAAVSIQVVMRYGFNSATTWSDTVAASAMAWMSLVSATAAIRSGTNISIRTFVDRLGGRARKLVDTFGHLATLVFALVLFVTSVQLVGVSRDTIVEGLFFDASWAEMYSIMPFCAALMVLFTLEKIAVLWLVREP